MLIAYVDSEIYNCRNYWCDLFRIDQRLLTGPCNNTVVCNPVDVFRKMSEINLKNIYKEQSLILGRKLTREEKKNYSTLIIVGAEKFKKITEKQKRNLEKQKAKLFCV